MTQGINVGTAHYSPLSPGERGQLPYVQSKDVQKICLGVLQQAVSSKTPLLLTSGSTSCPDSCADHSMLLRTFLNIWMDSPVLSAMGMTTAFNSLQGVIATYKAHERYKAGEKIGDSWGSMEAQIDIWRGIFQAAGGGVYAIVRPMTIACDLKGIAATQNSSSTLGQATFGIATIGNVLFAIFYGIIGGWAGYNIYKQHRFCAKLEKRGDADHLQDYIKFLVEKRLYASSSDTLSKLLKQGSRSANSQERVQEMLKKEGMQAAKEWVKATFLEIKKEKGSLVQGSDEDFEKIAESLFAFIENENSGSKDKLIESLNLDPELCSFAKKLSFVELTGLEVVHAKRMLKKQSKLARATSDRCVQKLKEANESQLVQRLASQDPVVRAQALKEAEEIMKEVGSSVSLNNRINWALFISGWIGFVASIAAFFFTGGMAPIVLGAIFLLVSILMMYVDVSFMNLGLQGEGPIGKWDKNLVKINTTVAAISTVAVIAIALAAPYGTVPLAALLISLAIAFLWLSTNAYAYTKLSEKDKRHQEAHPSLESLHMNVSVQSKDEKIDAKTKIAFKKLSKDDRRAIKADLAKGISCEPILTGEDRLLDWDYQFGDHFFWKEPSHKDVIKAVKSVYAKNHSLEMRSLLDYLTAFQKGECSLEELHRFCSNIKIENLHAIYGEIYNIRAKNGIRRFYDEACITNQMLAESIQRRIVSVKSQAQEEMIRITSLFSSLLPQT